MGNDLEELLMCSGDLENMHNCLKYSLAAVFPEMLNKLCCYFLVPQDLSPDVVSSIILSTKAPEFKPSSKVMYFSVHLLK